eukprot:CAMPEP_0184989006 /NCGR_PEP_ID=MMETSP1098-20130426/26487_1 /TAXON_ID=89044 /ORGANISM="Spumella elongata, Strain CCAP 955/1" /LENGTH=388 /DNA_ID=CAMNT_0027513885 /DNA_START=65 /DNA_END=1231 /DNA_ORIENTATION=-
MEATARSSDVSKDSSDVKAQVLQQRLLLLNHSSKCTIAEDQVCPVSRHCGQFKTLWQHILVCKDNGCKVIHCISSRYVLSHYANCAECDCLICPRVRESAKRESTDSSSSPNASCKKPRSSYWWASETFVQFTKAVTVNTNDFVSPSPAKHRSQSHSSFGSSSHSPYSTAQPLSVEKLNHNMHQMSIGGPPPRRPEVPAFPRSTHSPLPPHTTHTIYAGQGSRESNSSLDMLASAAAGSSHSSFDKPTSRPRSNSGASTVTATSSHSGQSFYSYSDFSTSATASVAPSVATTATGASTVNTTILPMRSSSSSSALFANLQPAPYVSASQPLHPTNTSSASVAQGEEGHHNYLSSFSSVCSYHGSAPASPYMSPRHSPVNMRKDEKFKY